MKQFQVSIEFGVVVDTVIHGNVQPSCPPTGRPGSNENTMFHLRTFVECGGELDQHECARHDKGSMSPCVATLQTTTWFHFAASAVEVVGDIVRCNLPMQCDFS